MFCRLKKKLSGSLKLSQSYPTLCLYVILCKEIARGIMMVGCFLVQGDCRALRARNDNFWCFGVVLCKEIASSFVPPFSQRQYLWFGGCLMGVDFCSTLPNKMVGRLDA